MCVWGTANESVKLQHVVDLSYIIIFFSRIFILRNIVPCTTWPQGVSDF